MGCLQLSLIPPTFESKGGKSDLFLTREGAFYIEAAPGIKDREKEWDWSKKVKFSLGVNDIALILDAGGEKEIKLVHDNSGAIKTLRFTPGDPNNSKYAGTWMMSILDGELKVTVPLSAGEMQVVVTLLKNNLHRLLGMDVVSPKVLN